MSENTTSEVKPETSNVGIINIKVVNHDGNELIFKLKKDTPLKKVMDAFYQRLGLQAGSVRFNYDGNRVSPDQTPASLNMEENDTIDAMIEQTGGNK